MLVIRMQRTGRKGHAMFRVVVQDSRRTPTSGKIVASLGSYDPHSKTANVNTEKAQFYLDHGAQPSERVAKLLQSEKIKLPAWVKMSSGKKRDTRNPDKRRSTRPEEPAAAEPEASAADSAPEAGAETPPEETPAADEAAPEAEAPAEANSDEETAPEPSEGEKA